MPGLIVVPLALSRSHRWWHLGASAAVVLAVVLLLPTGQVDVPFREGVRGEPWPAVLALLGAGLPGVLRSPGAGLAAALPRRPWQLRALTAAAVSVVALGAAAVACTLIDRPVDVGVRNAALSVALAVASAVALGIETAWVAPVLLTGASWLYGFDERSTPRPWAVLLWAPDPAALVLALAALAVTLAAWIALGERHAA